jgi:hypothetical protein
VSTLAYLFFTTRGASCDCSDVSKNKKRKTYNLSLGEKNKKKMQIGNGFI